MARPRGPHRGELDLVLVERRESGSRRAETAALLQGRIEGGAYPVGSTLPTEAELCAELGVSRYMLRQALQTLEEQGFIERKRRAGTRVLAAAPTNIFRHATGTINELVSFVQGTTVDLSRPRRIQADGKLARFLGCDELREWLLMEGIRLEIGSRRPIGITQIYIDPERAPLPHDVSFGGRPSYEWLRDKYNIKLHFVSQDISAVQLTRQEAESLSEHAGAPALKIIRRYFDTNNKIFQIAVTVHRSRDFIYNTRIMFE
jgi:DNA-binding GntR family transcriptional regulator